MAIPTGIFKVARLAGAALALIALVAGVSGALPWGAKSGDPQAAGVRPAGDPATASAVAAALPSPASDPAVTMVGTAGAPPRGAGALARPSADASATRGARNAIGCLIVPERVVDVGSPVPGAIASVRLDRGDAVARGATLVQLRADVEQASVQAAQARASIDGEVLAAEAAARLARDKHARAAQLVDEGFVAGVTVEQARAERDIAEQRVRQARGQRGVQREELNLVRAQLGLRVVRSPIDGVILERFVNDGEHVDDKPLMRVAQLDPLRVELVVPAARWGSIHAGEEVSIAPELSGVSARLAKVVHVDRFIDAASNTYRVRLRLPNPRAELPAGARCRAEGLEALQAAAPGALASPAAATGGATPVTPRLQAVTDRKPALVPASVPAVIPARGPAASGLRPALRLDAGLTA